MAHTTGLLLVNLGFWIFRFPILEIASFCKIVSKSMLVRYRGINNKGVLERPWTKWKVLRAISSTLKCQFTGKCWKVDFLMPCKTKSCQSSTECLRMVRALPPDTPRPPQFQPELWKIYIFVKNFIFPGSLTSDQPRTVADMLGPVPTFVVWSFRLSSWICATVDNVCDNVVSCMFPPLLSTFNRSNHVVVMH